jgi:hypothetical protein
MKALLAALLLLCCLGCVQPSVVTMTALQEHWTLIRPYADSGIDADTTLTPESKVLRKRTVAEFTALIDTAVEHGK